MTVSFSLGPLSFEVQVAQGTQDLFMKAFWAENQKAFIKRSFFVEKAP